MPQRGFGIVVATTLAFSLAGIAIAQVSTHYDLHWSVIAGGGSIQQSSNYMVQDTVGQPWVGTGQSTKYEVDGGFADIGGSIQGVTGDSFEFDDSCATARPIDALGNKQLHTFHDKGDQDWIKFTAEANRTYIIQVNNLGSQANAAINLFNNCGEAAVSYGQNAFGPSVQLEWDSRRSGDYFVGLRQRDATKFGESTNYDVAITVDTTPPSAPTNPRCISVGATTLGFQWQRSPEVDVRKYQIVYSGNIGGRADVDGGATTYYELSDLTEGQTYFANIVALDFSGNASQPTGQFECKVQRPPDSTIPSFSLVQPSAGATYTTTAGQLTFTGSAQDAGNNLSRAQFRNETAGIEKWDFSLAGASDEFRAEDLPLVIGDNLVKVTIFDAANNLSTQTVHIQRKGDVKGAVIIIAGHNEDYTLQGNIDKLANRAFRIFRNAGFSAGDIYYLAHDGQFADGDDVNDVDADASPLQIKQAITEWARTRVGPDRPLFVYLVDHGLEERFCAGGCTSGYFWSQELNAWLEQLEQPDVGLTELTIVIEACRSGGFIDRAALPGDVPLPSEPPPNPVAYSLSKAGRVVITSTSPDKNAYASPEGALFSDAFFSCLADSSSLKTCFDQSRTAVQLSGIAQLPWLDDNGDGLSDSADGSVAQARFVTRFFSSVRPRILATKLERDGADGTLKASVQAGAETIALVWATVIPPDFVEPTEVTLNLNVPTVRLTADPATPGTFRATYPQGFAKDGTYRIVFYAQDRLGIQAIPRPEGEAQKAYLPLIRRP